MGALAGGVLAGELCAPLLLLCWLCCWPDDNSDSSSSGHPKKPVVVNEGSRRWRRSSEKGEKGEKGEARARVAGSAVSLHVPGTSGCVWREEELGRYHSAPSVIREVLLRRDWDRSSRELHIPLHPPTPPGGRPPLASPEPSPPRCKKHHSNIKSSRAKEQRAAGSERDQESPSTFYIGDAETERGEERPLCQGKEEKQCLNESLRSRERPWRLPPGAPLLAGDLGDLGVMGLLDELDAPDGLDALDGLDGPDRSGAVHHALDSHAAAVGSARIAPLSPISVDVVGYEYEACACDAAPARLAALAGGAGGGARARHASDGDILAPTLRPESGAFSESDLDIELRLALQAEELQQLERRQARAGGAGGAGGSGGATRAERRETAI